MDPRSPQPGSVGLGFDVGKAIAASPPACDGKVSSSISHLSESRQIPFQLHASNLRIPERDIRGMCHPGVSPGSLWEGECRMDGDGGGSCRGNSSSSQPRASQASVVLAWPGSGAPLSGIGHVGKGEAGTGAGSKSPDFPGARF